MGKQTIYYFSGTGNSFQVAKDLAISINCELIPIASMVKKETITIESEIIGLVFPIYYGSNNMRIPMIVNSFIKKLKIANTKYIFAVCTYGGGMGCVFDQINDQLKLVGKNLSSGFGVHMPQNAFKKPSFLENIPKLLKNWEEQKKVICNKVIKMEVEKYPEDGFAFTLIKKILTTFLNFGLLEKKSLAKCAKLPDTLPFEDIVLHTDNSFTVGNECNGCKICAKVCPVDNIVIVNGKPLWKNHCENCLACYNWCPQVAIHDGIAQNYHYHNPNVSLSDFLSVIERIK